MIYISDLQKLINEWTSRMQGQQPAYKEALWECIYDINSLITRSLDEELSYEEYIKSWKADDFIDFHAA